MNDFWSGLIGAVAGGALTLLGAWAQAEYYRRDRRFRLKAALATEIGSIVALSRVNGYAEYLQTRLRELESREADHRPEPIVIPAEQNYFAIYDANAGGIGELDHAVAAKVIGFYQAARSWLDGMSRSNAVDQEGLGRDDAVLLNRLMLDRILKIERYGDDVVTQLGGTAVGIELTKVIGLLK